MGKIKAANYICKISTNNNLVISDLLNFIKLVTSVTSGNASMTQHACLFTILWVAGNIRDCH